MSRMLLMGAGGPLSGGDPDFASVGLLLHGDGVDGSTTFLDSSANAHTITAFGNAQLDTAQKQWGTASILLDGTGDYASLADTATLEIGSGDFTFEAWIRLSGYSPSYSGQFVGCIFGRDGPSNRCLNWSVNGTASSWTTLNCTIIADNTPNFTTTTGSFAFSLDTWYYVAAVRSGTTLTLYVGTTPGGATTDIGSGVNSRSMQNTANPFTIGSVLNPGLEFYFPGHIDDLRITKGVARDVSVVPSAAFPNN